MGTKILNTLLAPAWPLARSIMLNTPLRPQRVVYTAPCNLILSRYYSKSKDRGKDKKGKMPAKVEVNPLMMSELISVDKLRDQCNAAIDKMKEDFVKNLSIRSTTGSIETMKVKFGGKEHELQELAQIVRKNPKTMVLNFTSFPQAIPDALKAIQSSGLNLNPQQDGTTLYVPVPKVTKEHREALAKNARVLYIKCRDMIKEVQNDNIKRAKKSNSEDLSRSVQSQILALCEQYQAETRKIYNAKHDELLGK